MTKRGRPSKDGKLISVLLDRNLHEQLKARKAAGKGSLTDQIERALRASIALEDGLKEGATVAKERAQEKVKNPFETSTFKGIGPFWDVDS